MVGCSAGLGPAAAAAQRDRFLPKGDDGDDDDAPSRFGQAVYAYTLCGPQMVHRWHSDSKGRPHTPAGAGRPHCSSKSPLCKALQGQGKGARAEPNTALGFAGKICTRYARNKCNK
ncbi:hypothetical protein PLESTB_000439800 [Pleodorina starrii]|uniref:Uncharacterized protein n=1 Tax=Pleodorina starrii TaxID=330485 RepID=A0A9W6BEZ8_9CHLO|nr:hypothetical protein PLESTB_000439800 [Pleodorina starrii]GLC73945.1 hypothetical protein PLESTF_001440600 [Pleodorina starrii]